MRCDALLAAVSSGDFWNAARCVRARLTRRSALPLPLSPCTGSPRACARVPSMSAQIVQEPDSLKVAERLRVTSSQSSFSSASGYSRNGARWLLDSALEEQRMDLCTARYCDRSRQRKKSCILHKSHHRDHPNMLRSSMNRRSRSSWGNKWSGGRRRHSRHHGREYRLQSMARRMRRRSAAQ